MLDIRHQLFFRVLAIPLPPPLHTRSHKTPPPLGNINERHNNNKESVEKLIHLREQLIAEFGKKTST